MTIKYIARFEYDRLAIGTVYVKKTSAKQSELAECSSFAGYRTRVSNDELFDTREECLAAITPRVWARIEELRETANELAAAIGEP